MNLKINDVPNLPRPCNCSDDGELPYLHQNNFEDPPSVCRRTFEWKEDIDTVCVTLGYLHLVRVYMTDVFLEVVRLYFLFFFQ